MQRGEVHLKGMADGSVAPKRRNRANLNGTKPGKMISPMAEFSLPKYWPRLGTEDFIRKSVWQSGGAGDSWQESGSRPFISSADKSTSELHLLIRQSAPRMWGHGRLIGPLARSAIPSSSWLIYAHFDGWQWNRNTFTGSVALSKD